MKRDIPTVLVIEEVQERLNAVKKILENQPLHLEYHADSKTALQDMQRIDPDMVILDLSSQYAYKREFCKQVLEQKNAHTKFLFIAPKGFPEFIFVPKENCAGYVFKPYYYGDLLGKLHAALYDKYLTQMAT